ncbi:MAG: hypothetical protein ACI4KF_03665 [Huintestinicola sp.]
MSEMSEFIKRGTIYEKLDAIGGCDATEPWSQGWDKAIDEAISIVENAPAADAVEVVRCKDCKYYVNHDLCYCRNKKGLTDIVKPDDFCSYGERAENCNA